MEEIQAPQGQVKINKLEQPYRTYFYERPDGSVVGVRAEEAWSIHKARKFKQIGVSDGKIFYDAVKESHTIYKETGDFLRAQERIRQGEREEIEAARGNLMVPPNFDTLDKHGNPVNMRDLI